MNRRRFLAASAAGATASAGLKAAAPKNRLRLGFFGCTHSHGPAKLKLAVESPDWEVIGVCDPSEAGQAAARALGVPLLSEAELLERAEVVAVESAVRDHAGHALRALQAARHVHLEKPAAHRLEDMRALVAAARHHKRLLQVGYMWRYHPGFQAIREAARCGWLGEVFHVRGFIASAVAAESRKEWAEFSGGALFELGSHLIDATVRLLGRPRAVTPVLRHHGPFDDTLADNNVVVLEYERSLAVITNTALQAGGTPQRSFQVMGTNGTATLMPIEPGTLQFDLLAAAGPHPRGQSAVRLPEYRRYVADFAELASAVRGETSLAADLDEELLVGETVLQASGMT